MEPTNKPNQKEKKWWPKIYLLEFQGWKVYPKYSSACAGLAMPIVKQQQTMKVNQRPPSVAIWGGGEEERKVKKRKEGEKKN